MSKTELTEEAFKAVVAELFSADITTLKEDTDLSIYIKDSIDLGELVAVLKSRYGVEPKNWNAFKEETLLRNIFQNFVLIQEASV